MSLVHHVPRIATAGSAFEPSAAYRRPISAVPPADTARDLQHLEHAVTVALSPLDYSDQSAWGDALTAALCALANADTGAYLLPGAGPFWREVPRNGRAHDEATERLCLGDAHDLVQWARDDLADPAIPQASANSSGTIGIRIRTASGDVAAICVHRKRVLAAAPVELLAALRAIGPAFRAGVTAWVSAHACRTNIARMLDSLADAALVFDLNGTLAHANPTAERLTSATGATGLRAEAQRLAWTLGAMARRRSQPAADAGRAQNDSAGSTSASRRMPVAGMVYHVRASIIGGQLLGVEPAVLVTITAKAAEPLSDDTLHTEYGLTAREIQVARLIAEGLSNNEIAARLGVRFFTARNHVERMLAKLGVAGRNRVGPLLRNEVQEAADAGRASAA
jgi:DNA-binding CsgD family transcriptional regulator/PAS domain-containing protein